jgi:5-methylcytosine-specific restriction protein A
MTGIILGWNPGIWSGWDYADVVAKVAARGWYLDRWSVGRFLDIPAGSDAWLLLQGNHGRGLIGHGLVLSEPERGKHYVDPNKTTMYVDVEFDALLPLGEQIEPAVLKQAVPGVPWDAMFESGRTIAPSEEAKLRALWSELGPEQSSDPTHAVPGTYPEGAASRIEVNRYERSPDARRDCIKHRGTTCEVCGFSFGAVYGDIGKDFIHVHHIVPVSQFGQDYRLNPVRDLVPLCANCHAMAHRGSVSTPRSVAELKAIIENSSGRAISLPRRGESTAGAPDDAPLRD